MKFKYNIIGDNTKKNRDWLLALGYIPLEFFLNKKYIYTNFSNRVNFKEKWKEHYFETHDDIKLSIGEIDYINCIGNDKLFRAISTLNNDTDYMQWFISDIDFYGKEWFLCEKDRIKDCSIYCSFTKATLEELKEHFK